MLKSELRASSTQVVHSKIVLIMIYDSIMRKKCIFWPK